MGDVVEAQKISNATAATKTAFDEQDSLFELVRRCSKDAAACEQMELAAMNFTGAGEWREVLSKLTERLVEYNLMEESGEDEGSAAEGAGGLAGEDDGAVEEEGGEEQQDEEEEGGGAVVVIDPAAHSAAHPRVMRTYKLGKGKGRAGKGIGNAVKSNAVAHTKADFDAKMKRPYTWLDLEHADFLLSSFYFDHGSAHCRACGVGVSWFAWAQHIHGKVKGKETKHQANIKKLYGGAKKQASLTECVQRVEKRHSLVGQTLDDNTKASRADFVLMLFEANVSLACSEPLARRYQKGFDVHIGHHTGLSRFIPAVAEYELDKLRNLFEDSHPEFGAVVDGSPFFAEAEATRRRSSSGSKTQLRGPGASGSGGCPAWATSPSGRRRFASSPWRSPRARTWSGSSRSSSSSSSRSAYRGWRRTTRRAR